MRGAYGKPVGKVARVEIGQPIMSIRAKDAHKEQVVESLRRSKFKVSLQVVTINFVVPRSSAGHCLPLPRLHEVHS